MNSPDPRCLYTKLIQISQNEAFPSPQLGVSEHGSDSTEALKRQEILLKELQLPHIGPNSLILQLSWRGFLVSNAFQLAQVWIIRSCIYNTHTDDVYQ